MSFALSKYGNVWYTSCSNMSTWCVQRCFRSQVLVRLTWYNAARINWRLLKFAGGPISHLAQIRRVFTRASLYCFQYFWIRAALLAPFCWQARRLDAYEPLHDSILYSKIQIRWPKRHIAANPAELKVSQSEVSWPEVNIEVVYGQ